MPQLNPSPWLKLLLISWIILILPMTLMTMNTYTNTPTFLPKNKKDIYWTWTWT